MSAPTQNPAAVVPAPCVRVTFRADLPGRVCQKAEGVAAQPGDWCVIATQEGERLGRIAAFELPVVRPGNARPAGTVVRQASAEEISRAERLAATEREALRFCRERAKELSLAVRPVAALVPLDRDTVIVTFAADQKVDVKELVRSLSRHLGRRAVLHQVGVRDQAKLSGGWGPCGRALCCSAHMARFASISIRMAKAQNLSLNPARISGMCGRLMCCLAHEAAETAARGVPAAKP